MKDIFQIFDENFVVMQKLANEQNFQACLPLSNNLITTSLMVDYKDGVFIGEVFEAIYSEVDNLFRRFEIVEEEQNRLKSNFNEYIPAIASLYKKSDKNE